MSDQHDSQHDDGLADAFAAIAIIAIVVGTVVFWLSSMPS